MCSNANGLVWVLLRNLKYNEINGTLFLRNGLINWEIFYKLMMYQAETNMLSLGIFCCYKVSDRHDLFI